MGNALLLQLFLGFRTHQSVFCAPDRALSTAYSRAHGIPSCFHREFWFLGHSLLSKWLVEAGDIVQHARPAKQAGNAILA